MGRRAADGRRRSAQASWSHRTRNEARLQKSLPEPSRESRCVALFSRVPVALIERINTAEARLASSERPESLGRLGAFRPPARSWAAALHLRYRSGIRTGRSEAQRTSKDPCSGWSGESAPDPVLGVDAVRASKGLRAERSVATLAVCGGTLSRCSSEASRLESGQRPRCLSSPPASTCRAPASRSDFS